MRAEAITGALLLAGCVLAAGGELSGEIAGTNTAAQLAERWGIEVASLRPSAAGRIVDFRYRVLDADKAARLASPEAKAYLIDQASGTRLHVPNTPKVGPLRQSAEQVATGKVYFVLFANPYRIVKSGSKVTILTGDFRVENLTVE